MKFTKIATNIKKNWVVIDAENQIFGRVISQAAHILRGKDKPYFTPHLDCGDNVIIINAKKVKFSGNKLENKNYYTHSGYFGSVKSKKMSEMFENHTLKLFKLSLRGMLPKTKLGAEILKNVRIYENDTHPHSAQIKGDK